MISWYVAHTQSLKERVAQHHLIDQGFEVYLPCFKKIRRHARKADEVLTPLFPRYLFIGMDMETASWRRINGTRGISYLLMSQDNCPASIPLNVIENLKSQEISSGIVPVASLISFSKGDKVRVLEGAFQDQIGTFETLDHKSRVQILLSFLGREMKVSLPLYVVDAA